MLFSSFSSFGCFLFFLYFRVNAYIHNEKKTTILQKAKLNDFRIKFIIYQKYV